MCGIVGYTGKKDACEVLLQGLMKLEYRGYDSSGIAVISDKKINEKKYKGKLNILAEKLKKSPVSGNTGIGHTRWATHGEPSDRNAHPHSSMDRKISVVHNGIFENYAAVKKELISEGVVFRSETDTEAAVHLIRKYYDGDLLTAVSKALEKLRGAYAMCIISADEPGRIIAVRKDSPLIIGISENENFIASDIPAFLNYTREVYLIDNGTIADVSENGIKLYDEKLNPITKEIYHVTWKANDATKSGYKHYMLKEINEQPVAIKNTLLSRLDADSTSINFETFSMTAEEFRSLDRIYIAACGTAAYAGAYGKLLIEKYARMPAELDVASEFRYRNPVITPNTLFIAISQSGETADTLESMRLAKRMGAKVLAVTNVVGSSIDRESENTIYTMAGPEIAVASTKAYLTQVISMTMLAMMLGQLSGNLSDEDFAAARDALLNLPAETEKTLSMQPKIKKLARMLKEHSNIFFIGRGFDYCLSLEGALKMKELSYIHAEAYQGGELKHGPIALLDRGVPVIALCTQKNELFEKTLNSIKEVKARGAYVIAVTQKSMYKGIKDSADEVLLIDDIFDDTAIIPAAVLLQFLAYYTAVYLKKDVDKPRNLAKSVTVE